MKTKIPYSRMTRNQFAWELYEWIQDIEFIDSPAEIDAIRLDGGKIAIRLDDGSEFEIAISIPIPCNQARLI